MSPQQPDVELNPDFIFHLDGAPCDPNRRDTEVRLLKECTSGVSAVFFAYRDRHGPCLSVQCQGAMHLPGARAGGFDRGGTEYGFRVKLAIQDLRCQPRKSDRAAD